MIAQTLKAFFDPYFDVPLKVWESFAKELVPVGFKKNEMIKQPHKKESHLHIITSGSAGLFVYKDGHDICIDLCYEGEFTGDYFSLLQQQCAHPNTPQESPLTQLLDMDSPIYVMALEPLETLSISKKKLFTLYEQSEIGKYMARMIAEVLYLHKQHQQIELLTLTAEQRYRNLLKKQPDILQKTASKHIASYLGITPESFSRIRKKIFL